MPCPFLGVSDHNGCLYAWITAEEREGVGLGGDEYDAAAVLQSYARTPGRVGIRGDHGVFRHDKQYRAARLKSSDRSKGFLMSPVVLIVSGWVSSRALMMKIGI